MAEGYQNISGTDLVMLSGSDSVSEWTIKYCAIGRIIVGDITFKLLATSGSSFFTGLVPSNVSFSLPVRDSNNGNANCSIWVRDDSTYLGIAPYGGANLVVDHSYQGTFCYISK